MVKILPQLFYETPEINKILVDGLSCMVHKKLNAPVWHKEGYVSAHAITLVIKGLLRIENDAGMYTEVPENKMILLPKGLYTISDIIPKGDRFEAIVFFFDKDVLDNFVNSLQVKGNKQHCVSHLILDYSENVRIFTENLLRLYGGNEKPHRQLTAMKLFELLHLIHTAQDSDCFARGLATLNNKERRSLKEFMHANFSKPLGIEDYAYLTGRSLSSFRRDFKAQFGGISPKQWLIDRRLEKAHQLLSKNHTTVTDVVFETGYENIPHFIKAFKEKYGLPPKQFLIQQRKAMLV